MEIIAEIIDMWGATFNRKGLLHKYCFCLSNLSEEIINWNKTLKEVQSFIFFCQYQLRKDVIKNKHTSTANIIIKTHCSVQTFLVEQLCRLQ